jgi:hypothetical protein
VVKAGDCQRNRREITEFKSHQSFFLIMLRGRNDKLNGRIARYLYFPGSGLQKFEKSCDCGLALGDFVAVLATLPTPEIASYLNKNVRQDCSASIY